MKSNLLISIFILLISGLSAQNNCLEFDGTNDYVHLSGLGISTASGDKTTVEFWMYWDGTYASMPFGWMGYDLYFYSSSFGFNTGAGDLRGVSATSYINKWIHVAAIFVNNTTTDSKLYINGIEQSLSQILGTPTSKVVTDSAGIGTWGYFSGEYFGGKIDELRIWNGERTETQIRQNMYRELPTPGSETNLVAYYKMNSTSGFTAIDSKGSIDGTLTNMTGNEWQTSPAMFGPKNCLDFDGTNDYVQTSTSINIGNTFTVEFWMNANTLKDSGDPLSFGPYNSDYFLTFVTYEDGHMYFATGDGNAAWGSAVETAAGTFAAGIWYHVTGISTGQKLQLYVNGLLIGESGSNTNSVNQVLSLGSRCTYAYYFDGMIDEVRIWNDVRTATEIRENMCKSITGNESGLLAYYNNDTVTYVASLEQYILIDYSGNGHDGTVINGTVNAASSAFNTWLNTSSSAWSTTTNWSLGSKPSIESVGIYSYTGGSSPVFNTGDEAGGGNIVVSQSSDWLIGGSFDASGNLFLESNIDLNGQGIYLGSASTLIEDNGILHGSSGSIQTTRALSNIDENVAGLGAEITTSANMGSTLIKRSYGAASDPVSIDRKYEINPTTTTGLNATLVFHYDDGELNGQTEADLKLYKSSDGTNWDRQSSSTVNTTNNTITQTGIDGFLHWTASNGLYLTGNALDFDGSGDYVDIPANATLNNDNFTVEFWAKLTATQTWNTLLDKGLHHTPGDWYFVCDNGSYGIIFGYNTGNEFVIDMGDNNWHHIAVTCNGTNIYGYLDGKLIHSSSSTYTKSTNAIRMGRRIDPTGSAGDYYFNGKMDDVRIWSSARTAQQIQENMCNTLVGDESGIVAYYNCNSSSGTTLYDISSNGNDGTLEGNPTWVGSTAFDMWKGETSTTWGTASNWSSGSAPVSTSNIGITGRTTTYSPEIGSSVSLSNLVVNTDKSLYIAPGNDLTVNNLFNYGTFTINSDATGTGSLIVNGTSSGNITAQRYVDEAKTKGYTWHYVSSPVSGQVFSTSWMMNNSILFNDPAYQLYRFDEDTDYWIYYGYSGSEPEDFGDATFIDARGYAATRTAAGELSFTGTVRTSDVTYAATYTTDKGDGFNLVGNPFTSSLMATTTASATLNFLTVNENILDNSYEALYIWDEQANYSNTRNDYKVISNGTISGYTKLNQNYIAPGQAFMVKVVSGGGNLAFNTNMQAHNNATFYKNEKESWPSVELIVENDEVFNSTTIGFNENMTNGLDPSYDIGKIKGNPNIALYTRLVQDNGVDFAIQALPNNDIENIVIPVGIDVSENQICEFNVNTKAMEDYPVYLQDIKENTVTNLKEQTYSTLVNVSGIGRFFIYFRKVSDITNTKNIINNIQIWSSNKVINIFNKHNLTGDIKVLNVVGQNIVCTKLTGNQNQQLYIDVPSGYYIINIITKKGVVNKKLYLR